MPIPEFNELGELPPGEHEATLDEIEQRFGSANAVRRRLMGGLRRAAANLAAAGVRKIWVDGSFITSKAHPNDIDGVWDSRSQVNYDLIDPVFGEPTTARMKEKFGLDFYENVIEAGSGKPFPYFFQTNRLDEPKGIVVVQLGA
ncbi:MAG: hypothetical protein ACE5EU_04215 [Paracoccaceae bacterium]